MKKLFTSFVAAGTVASFAACGKKDKAKSTTTKNTKTGTKTEAKKTVTVKKGSVKQGTFKIGIVGSDVNYSVLLGNTVREYTQDVTEKSSTGKEYFELPSGLFLQSSSKYDSLVEQTKIDSFRKELKKFMVFYTGKQGGISAEFSQYSGVTLNNGITNGEKFEYNARMMLYGDSTKAADDAAFDKIFTDSTISNIIVALGAEINPNPTQLFNAFMKAGVPLAYAQENGGSGRSQRRQVGSSNYYLFGTKAYGRSGDKKIYWTIPNSHKSNKGTGPVVVLFGTNSPNYTSTDVSEVDLGTSLFAKAASADFSKKALSDKTKLASKNLDALFIHVTDEKENSSDVYKSVVEKKEFKETQLFFIGEKAKSQSGASSKTFAGGNVSTASFNKYAAAYVGGFQAAVGAIKYSSSEDEYEETNVVFLIGSTSESEDKKKAFAFRRGVEAAAAHPAYSKYLKVKFVSKTADSSKSSKKLYREISEWKAIDDSKTKLYEFSSSDTFSDGDRRVVYIAGATAKDWTGISTDKATAGTWAKDDDTGLIGALYNYAKVGGTKTDSSLSSKTFGGSGVWIILDKHKKVESNSLVGEADAKSTEDDFERRDVQFMGFIGQEASGTKNYVKFAIRGHFMGGANYMVGKHSIFGAPIAPYQAKFKPTDSGVTSEEVRKQPWQFQKTGKDTVGKNYDRFRKSLAYAWSLEVTEAELTKSSPWLK